jgi:NADH-quinone oxidoreductase subunit H
MTLPLADVFTVEPWWMQIIKGLVFFLIVFNFVPVTLLAERKILGRFQGRYGPNRVGPFGAAQAIADIGKLLGKQQFTPRHAQTFLYILAPCLSVIAAAGTVAVIPFGPVVDIFGVQTGLYGIDVSVGILYVFALGAISFYGLMLGGWASANKYSFLGAMRSAAQLISYEAAQGMALVGVVIMAGSLSLVDIVEAQGGSISHTAGIFPHWYFIPQFVGMLIFIIAGFAESNRAPFALPEGESEIIGGYGTEYGGGRFANYYMAEYLELIVISFLTVTLYFGGWNLPFGIHPPHWVDPFVVIFKALFMIFFFIWIRATLPSLRYDQLMSFGWKVLLPLATLNTLVTAILVVTL